MANQERYVFNVEWYDSAAALIRNYNFFYYPSDSTMEMYDIKQKRMFLKRCELPTISIKDLFIGSIITVFSRQLKIVEYGDVFTRSKLEISKGKTFAMIKPDAYNNIGKIVDVIEKNGFNISNLKMTKLTPQDAQEFYADLRGTAYFDELTQFVCSDFVVGLELIADDSIAKWRNLIGPTNPQQARNEAPNSIRAIFGEQGVRNAVHGSDSPASAQRELSLFFSEKSKLTTTAFFNNCTCCVIKPHILGQRQAGQILDIILQEGFEISALQMFTLDRPTAEEFLEVYKGVVPEYGQLAEQLTTGPCLALEIRQENVVESFRQLCGPHDPDLAKIVRKNTIRSRFGTDKVKNAVHCTDLAEDGIIEVEYFFNILQQKA